MSLKELREKAGLKQAEVAKELNVDQTAVSNWERGVNKPLKKYHEQLAGLYNCSKEELLRGE